MSLDTRQPPPTWINLLASFSLLKYISLYDDMSILDMRCYFRLDKRGLDPFFEYKHPVKGNPW